MAPNASYDLLERAVVDLQLEVRRARPPPLTILVASIDDLIAMVSTRVERALLCAVREKRDAAGRA